MPVLKSIVLVLHQLHVWVGKLKSCGARVLVRGIRNKRISCESLQVASVFTLMDLISQINYTLEGMITNLINDMISKHASKGDTENTL